METRTRAPLVLFLVGGGGCEYSGWRMDLAPWYQRSSHSVAQSAASFLNGGPLMATTSRSGLEVLRLPELLVLIQRTAEWARNRPVLNPREAMVVCASEGSAIGRALRRVEPKWRKPGDVEADFFALYDASRSKV